MTDANGWQDIATAPRDGQIILVWDPHGSGQTGGYSPVWAVKWDRDRWREATGECWDTVEPTHWQPLPKGPGVEG